MWNVGLIGWWVFEKANDKAVWWFTLPWRTQLPALSISARSFLPYFNNRDFCAISDHFRFSFNTFCSSRPSRPIVFSRSSALAWSDLTARPDRCLDIDQKRKEPIGISQRVLDSCGTSPAPVKGIGMDQARSKATMIRTKGLRLRSSVCWSNHGSNGSVCTAASCNTLPQAWTPTETETGGFPLVFFCLVLATVFPS